MELEIVINENCKEKVLIYAREKSPLIDEIEELINNFSVDLIGFIKDEAVKLNANEIVCFFTEDNKVYALTENRKFKLKCRLYSLEEQLGDNFIKINQSCLANIRKISHFKASLGGALEIVFEGGYSDYVSRRNLKSVKERLGL